MTVLEIVKGTHLFSDTWKIPAGKKVYCQPGSTFIFRFNSVKNAIEFSDDVNFEASGCTFVMEWDTTLPFPPDGDDGPHLLAMYGVKNVLVVGGTYRNAVIDGIYVSNAKGTHQTCENILIKNVVTLSCRRQGISVISANGLLVTSSVFSDTQGTSPQSGIDVEPNHPLDTLNNIRFVDVTCSNNASHAFFVNLSRFSPSICDIKFTRCVGSKLHNSLPVQVIGPVNGKVNFNDSLFWGNA